MWGLQTKKKVFLANIYERIWPKKSFGDTEHEWETLITGGGMVYILYCVCIHRVENMGKYVGL